jgi:hypothetical protein
MEDVLDLCAEASDPKRPVVCFDESPIQHIGELRQPIPPAPGKIERYDLRVPTQRDCEPVRVRGCEPPMAQGEGH